MLFSKEAKYNHKENRIVKNTVFCYNHITCSHGGIGRRVRLKIVSPMDVRVQFSLRAPD